MPTVRYCLHLVTVTGTRHLGPVRGCKIQQKNVQQISMAIYYTKETGLVEQLFMWQIVIRGWCPASALEFISANRCF